jgi:AraC-like DNA-binding protein
MLHPPVTVQIAFVHGLLTGVRAHAGACEPFLAAAGIAPELLQQPGSRVTADQFVRLFRALIEGLDDDFLALMSRPLRRGSFALIARSVIDAGTLDVAMTRMTRTFGLLQDDVVLERVQQGGLAGLALRFTDPARQWPVFVHEVLVRVFWRLLAWMAGGRLPAARFDFAFGMPGYVDSYGKIFPAPLHFDGARTAFWFDARRLEDAVRRDKAALRSFMVDAHQNVVVPQRGDDALASRVRGVLQGALPAWLGLAATANALHMAASTMQRRLGAEGTTFQTLKDELRRDIAIVRLHTSTVALSVLADELGFANGAAFQRAFKSWTGSAPGIYRRGEGARARGPDALEAGRAPPGTP